MRVLVGWKWSHGSMYIEDWGSSSIFVVLSFFFFQAEDGIRDVAVTGVQTCALPISDLSGGRGRLARAARRTVHRDPRTLQPADRAAHREDRPGKGPGMDRQGRPAVEHGAAAPGKREGGVSDRLVVIGAIARAHGLAGEVRVTPMTDDPARFGGVRECVLWDTAHERRERYRITAVRPQGTAILLTLAGCDSAEAAAALAGRLLA